MKLGALLVVCAVAAPAHADFRFAHGNDLFTELDAPVDDDGFTTDFDIRFWRPYRGYQIGGRLVDRWITEVPRSGGRRRDLLELVGTLERSWQSGPFTLTAGGRAGPSLTGNVGGRWMQDGWHRLCDCGDSLARGLQDRYEGDGGIGALVGSRVEGRVEAGVVVVYGVVDDQVVIGNGVTFLDAAAGVRVTGGNSVELSAHAEVAAMGIHASDRLTIPGGFDNGWHAAYRIGLHVAWSRYRVEYQYRANEGGSGEPIGVVAFTVKQAGTTF